MNPEITFCTIDDNVIQKCLNFLLSDNYIIASAYGTREIVLYPDEVITLPCLTRKMSRHLMVRDYLQSTSADEDQIKRASLYKILKYTTYSDEAVLGAIDYVISQLVMYCSPL